MKKRIYLLTMCAGLLLVSCEKDEIGGTATQALAGEWYVTVDGVDNSYNVVEQDPYGAGKTILCTYNTVANIPTEMYVDDLSNFWVYKVKVKSDIESLTFTSNGPVANEYYDCNVTIENGKVLPGAATSPHGTPADSIVFYVTFDDDPYMGYYYDKLKVSGYRYTGLTSDD